MITVEIKGEMTLDDIDEYFKMAARKGHGSIAVTEDPIESIMIIEPDPEKVFEITGGDDDEI